VSERPDAPPMGVILAAGKGTRMEPFSTHYPKPILPVAGQPLMAHQLTTMAALGVTEIVVVIGHLGHEVVRTLGDGERFGVHLTYVEQEKTLGIAHAVSRLEPHVDRPFFLFLGDIYFRTEGLARMVDAHRAGADGVLAVKREPDPEAIKRNFTVLAESDGRVSRVVEKPRFPRTDLKGCGIYLFGQAFFDAVRRTPRTALRDEYEITDSIQIFIDDGYRVEAAEVVREDVNVSYPRDLLDLNLRILDRESQDTAIEGGAIVHPGARLTRSVVMAGAEVADGVVLEDCLVFPRARVLSPGHRRRVILTPEGEIEVDR